MTNTILTKWFGMKDDRGGFKTTLTEDFGLLLGNPIWQKEVKDVLETASLLDEPVRLVWWGGYGIGKTHRLKYMEHLIETNSDPYVVASCVCSDIDEKTPFAMLLEKIMLAIGKDKVQSVIQNFIQANPNNWRDQVNSWIQNPDISQAYSQMDNNIPDAPLVGKAWNFLMGRALEGQDNQDVGVSKKKLENSNEFVDVIRVFSKALRIMESKRLLIMIDEAENLERLKLSVATTKWREPMRYILEDDNTGMVLTLGAESQEEIPPVLAAPDIVRRIQLSNFKHLQSCSSRTEVEQYVGDLIKLVIDTTKLQSMKTAGEVPSDPSFNDSRYPFENDSTFEEFCQMIADEPMNAKPSVIMDKLQRLAVVAYKDNSKLITRVHLASIFD